MDKRDIISAVIVILLMANFAGIYTTKKDSMGGLIHNINEKFTAGITLEDTLTAVDATFSSTVDVIDSSKSTLQIGDASASNNSGCLVLGDSSSTGTMVYITASGSTITATTTQPAICK